MGHEYVEPALGALALCMVVMFAGLFLEQDARRGSNAELVGAGMSFIAVAGLMLLMLAAAIALLTGKLAL